MSSEGTVEIAIDRYLCPPPAKKYPSHSCDQNSTQIFFFSSQFVFSSGSFTFHLLYPRFHPLFVPLFTPEQRTKLKRASSEVCHPNRHYVIRIRGHPSEFRHWRSITGYWRASSEESLPNRHYESEGVHLSFVNLLESFIGGIPTESALRIRGIPSELYVSERALRIRGEALSAQGILRLLTCLLTLQKKGSLFSAKVLSKEIYIEYFQGIVSQVYLHS